MDDEVLLLVLKAQRGDAKAFSELYEFYYRRIYRFIYYLVYDPEIAKDLTQNTFVKTWRSLPAFVPEKGTLQAFIFAIARNTVIDHQRRKKELSLDVVKDIESKEDIGENIVNRERKNALYTVLSLLKGDEKQLIVLRYFEELSYAEIAEVVGKDEGTVRVRVHRILKKMKENMQAYEH